MATRALSADAGRASSEIPEHISAPSRRTFIVGGAAIASVTAVTRSCWSKSFDPDTWVERWYRAGHSICANPKGRPMLVQSMNADEGLASSLRGELGYHNNRHALLRHLSQYRAARPGIYSGYQRMAS